VIYRAPSRHRSGPEVAADLARFTRKASRSIGIPPVSMSELRADPSRIDELFRRLIPQIVEETQRRVDDTATARTLVSMAVEVADLDHEWRQCRQREAERAREDLAASLLRLPSLRTDQDNAEQICEGASRGCGSERVLFAWIHAENWVPVSSFRAGSRKTRPRVTAEEPLSRLSIERGVVERRQAARVRGPGDGPQPVAVSQLMGRSSFAIAPVVAEDRIVGLIYAAESASSLCRNPDLSVRLGRYANCLGGHLELVRIRRRLDARSAQVRQALSALQHAVTESDTSVDLMQLVGREQAGPSADETDRRNSPPLVSVESEFTAREGEVMTLISAGLDNKQIAEQLAIAESTVKSHVQHMLRKAGAVNRSELIGQFYAAGPPSPGR